MSDDLDVLLQARLSAVAEPPPSVLAGLSEGLHRRYRRRQRRLVATGVAFGVVAAVGGTLGATGLGFRDGNRTQQLASPDGAQIPAPANTPVPGISPAFTLTSGRDWLPTPAEFLRFRAAHPITGLGDEPAGTTAERLLEEVRHGGLPGGAVAQITPEGELPVVTVRMPDGTPIQVHRFQKLYPTAVNPDVQVKGATYDVVDIPGTPDAALLRSRTGFQWPKGTIGDSDANGDGDTNDSPSVITATSRGLCTFWVAPASINLGTLRQYALAATQWSAANP